MAHNAGSYTHFRFPMKSTLVSILAIVASAVPGVTLAWLLMSALGLSGTWLGLATVFTAMVFSVLIFAGLVALARLLGVIRK
jgi:ABC-type glycerol-3-phosphate transport system permease component